MQTNQKWVQVVALIIIGTLLVTSLIMIGGIF